MTERTGWKKKSYVVCASAAGLALLGVLLWWPLGILAIVLAVFVGRCFLYALIIGAVLDVLWGIPPGGVLSFLIVPCTLAAFLTIGTRLLADKFLRA